MTLSRVSEKLIPFSIYLLFFSIFSSASGIGAGTALIAIFGLYYFRDDLKAVPRLPLFWPVLAFCGAVTLSVIFSPYEGFAKPLGKLKYFLFYFLLVLSFHHFPRTKPRLLKISVGLAILLGVIAILQFFGIFDPMHFLFPRLNLAVIPQSNGHFFHARGLLYHHNPFAFGCLLLYFLTLGQALTAPDGKTKCFYSLGVVFAMVGILASNSRGAWMALAISASVILVTVLRRQWAALVPFAIAVVVAACLLGGALEQRFKAMSPSENMERLRLWTIAFQMFEESPILGNGFHLGFERRREAFMTRAEKENPFFPTDPHSIYFDLLGTTGLVGFAAFLYLIFAALSNYYRALRQAPVAGEERGILIAGLGAFLCFLVGGAFDSHLFHTETLVGMIFALGLGQSVVLESSKELAASKGRCWLSPVRI